MGAFANLLGTVLTSFGIGPKGARATLDASALTANRTVSFPDKAGTFAMTSDTLVALTSDLNLYVNGSTGNDANDGLGSGTAVAKIQKAVDIASRYLTTMVSGAETKVIINIADGTYTDPVTINRVRALLRLTGSTSAILNITATWGVAITSSRVEISGLKICNSSSAGGLLAVEGAVVTWLGGTVFGQCALFHYAAARCSVISINGAYTIAGSSPYHFGAFDAATLTAGANLTVTLTGTPNFSSNFLSAGRGGVCNFGDSTITWSGSATGKRYDIYNNATVWTGGRGAAWLPGSVSGTSSSGATYT